MNILVTGGAGFIGYNVAKALLERGDSVIIVDDFNDYYDPKLKKDRIKDLKKRGFKFTLYKKDISNFNKMKKIFENHKIDKICHLAAQAGVRYSLDHPFVYEKSNGWGTLSMLELARQFKIKDFVFASSSSVYGNNKKIPFSESDNVDNPISLYAATKKYDELMAYAYHHLYGLNCTGLRFFTVYGPWGRPDMALYIFAKGIAEGKPVDVYNEGNMKRDFTFIEDIVAGVLSALDKPLHYEIINLGNNRPVELNYFIGLVENELGKKAIKNFLPMQPGDVPETFADIEKARKLLNYAPKTPVEQGVKKFIEWYKEYDKIV